MFARKNLISLVILVFRMLDLISSKLKRGPQVILPKDMGAIVAHTGIGAGDRVVEAGAGSGWLTVMLANIVGAGGRVYSYEWREEFLKLAEKNVKKVGFDDRIELKQQDIFSGIDEKEVNVVVLDLAESEKAVGRAFAALRRGGKLVGYHPNIEQAKKFVETCHKVGFSESKVIEVIEREWLIRDYGCRPSTQGLTHTAFLSFSSKP